MNHPKFKVGDVVTFNDHEWTVNEVVMSNVFNQEGRYEFEPPPKYIITDDLNIVRRGIPESEIRLFWRKKVKSYRSIDEPSLLDSEESCEPN